MFVFYAVHNMSIKHISVSTDNLPTDAESVADHHDIASHAVEDVFIFKQIPYRIDTNGTEIFTE
jgi:hypothetical protein